MATGHDMHLGVEASIKYIMCHFHWNFLRLSTQYQSRFTTLEILVTVADSLELGISAMSFFFGKSDWRSVNSVNLADEAT